MVIGKVIGSVWATKKDERLNGSKLLVVEMKNKDIIAVDRIGAGVGDEVLVCFGSSARLASSDAPVDAAVVGIIDSTERN